MAVRRGSSDPSPSLGSRWRRAFELCPQPIPRRDVSGLDPVAPDPLPVGIRGIQTKALQVSRLAHEELVTVREQVPALGAEAGARLVIGAEPAVEVAPAARGIEGLSPVIA